jgi:hypothetical protein
MTKKIMREEPTQKAKKKLSNEFLIKFLNSLLNILKSIKKNPIKMHNNY